jgi:hypothetical protein
MPTKHTDRLINHSLRLSTDHLFIVLKIIILADHPNVVNILHCANMPALLLVISGIQRGLALRQTESGSRLDRRGMVWSTGGALADAQVCHAEKGWHTSYGILYPNFNFWAFRNF